MGRVFGLEWVAPAHVLNTSRVKDIATFIKLKHKRWIPEDKTLIIKVEQIGRNHNNSELEMRLNSMIGVDVSGGSPGETIYIELNHGRTYIYLKKLLGIGGLPLGSKGRVVALISGGIDSPVAAWLMMRRGVSIAALYASTKVSADPLKRFIDVMKALKRWHYGEELKSFIYTYSFDISKLSPQELKYAYILERRMMVRVACALAEKIGAEAVVTGDSLGQVSSQTLKNIMVVEEASKLPIIRPLIGVDKQEIVDLAKKIGTYEFSIKKVPPQCGTLPICIRKPVTSASLKKVKELEKKLKIDKAFEKALLGVKNITGFIG